MQTSFSDACIALAGLFQAVEQMQHCARSGEIADQPATDAVLEAVLRIDAASTTEVFGGLSQLRSGLANLRHHLLREMDVSRLEQARYAANLMFLERRLSAARDVAGQLGTAIQLLSMERAGRAVHDPWMLDRMASLYVDYVSPLGPRIMVNGEPQHLKGEGNAERIRALLLAGLRAAVLWHQLGGRRWKLLIFRSAMLRDTEALLQRAERDC
jgi:high frequency lysogenization protein